MTLATRIRTQAADGAFAQLVWHRGDGLRAGRLRHARHARRLGRMVFASVDDGVQWTTMLSHRTPGARRTWRVLGHAHRTIAPLCLAQARLRLAR